MKKISVIFALTALLSMVSSPLWGQDIYYVQSLKARVMTKPSFKAAVIAEVGKGSRLQTAGRQGSWVKVTLAGKEGYVSSLLLSKQPPLERKSLIRAEGGDIRQSVRRRASTYTSAAAARGLTHEDRKRVSAEEEVNYGALEKMEALTFSAEDVTRFIEGGNI